MGAVDMERQALNVARMKFLGAEVVTVTAGQATLKEAISEAMRDWVTNVRTTHYILGSALGSHPYPMMVRDFQRVIGDETQAQTRISQTVNATLREEFGTRSLHDVVSGEREQIMSRVRQKTEQE